MWGHLLLVVPLVIPGLLAVPPWTTALPVAMGLAVPTALVAHAAWRVMRQPVVTGAHGLRGHRGEAVRDVNPDARWLAEARQPLARAQAVEVMDVVGARVQVRRWT